MKFTTETLPNILEFINEEKSFFIIEKDNGIYETSAIGNEEQ